MVAVIRRSRVKSLYGKSKQKTGKVRSHSPIPDKIKFFIAFPTHFTKYIKKASGIKLTCPALPVLYELNKR